MLDEIYYLSKHANFRYSDILIMPIYERKYFVNKLVEEFEKRNEVIEKQKTAVDIYKIK